MAGLHAATMVDLQLLTNDLASICHGSTSDTGTPALPTSDHGNPCCLIGCSAVGQAADLGSATAGVRVPLVAGEAALPVQDFTRLPPHLSERAHSPRSPPAV